MNYLINTLKQIVERGECLCGAGSPEDWSYQLKTMKFKNLSQSMHNPDCPISLADKALAQRERYVKGGNLAWEKSK